MLKLSRDVNGNKTLKYSPTNGRGFSVQTLGNLPATHSMDTETFNKPTKADRSLYHKAMDELRMYIKQYGTEKQKTSLGLSTS